MLVARGRAPDGGSVAICDACWLGNQIALRYECQGCGGVQRIPHPMWRYQVDGPEAFGTTPWACHVRCGTYTRWRVISEDVARVPHGDAPESWGVDIVRQIRERQQARAAARQARVARDAVPAPNISRESRVRAGAAVVRGGGFDNGHWTVRWASGATEAITLRDGCFSVYGHDYEIHRTR